MPVLNWNNKINDVNIKKYFILNAVKAVDIINIFLKV